MPTPLLKRIYQLPSLTTPATQLAGGYLVWDVPLGPVPGGYKSYKGTAEELAAYLRNQGLLGSESAALLSTDPTTGTLTYEAPKNLSPAEALALGLAIVTSAGVTHYPFGRSAPGDPASTYDSGTGELLVTLPAAIAPADVVSVHLYRMSGGQEHPLHSELLPFGVDAYTRAQADQLLATKQTNVSAWVNEYVFFQTYTLSRSRLNQYVILTTSYGLTTITLPTVTVADAGAVIELLQAAGASSGLVRLVDTTGALVALLQTAGALVSLRLVISGTATRWVVVGRSNEALIPIALGAIRNLRDLGRLSPDTLYLVDDNQWGTVYVRALDTNRLAALGDALNTTTGKMEAVKLDVDTGTYASILAGGVTQAQLVTVATTLPLTATRTADYTLQLADAGCLVPLASPSALVVEVPSHADVPFAIGTTVYVAQDGAGTVTIAAAPGVVVHTTEGYLVPGQWTDVSLHKRDLNTWVLKGSIQ